MYPNLREDRIHYVEKWGLIRRTPAADNEVGYSFADVAVLRQISGEMAKGVTFRAAVRAVAAERDGQMALDFASESAPARIVALRPRIAQSVQVEPEVVVDRTAAEEHFLAASRLDDGTAENQEAAARAYRLALEADPYLIPALINLGNLHYARDERIEAQALYERALSLAPDVYEAHFNLGNVHHDRGRFETACQYYQEALRLNPQYAEAHFYLAVTLEKMGCPQEARTHWRAYQQLAPGGEWIHLAREFGDDPDSTPQ